MTDTKNSLSKLAMHAHQCRINLTISNLSYIIVHFMEGAHISIAHLKWEVEVPQDEEEDR